jgi:HEAT repeat protein
VQSKRLLLRGMLCLTTIFGLVATVAAAEENDELVQMVVDLLGDKDKDLRAVGLEQVRTEAKGQAATKQFAAQLPKLPPEVRVGLLSALADRGDAAARPAVLDILSTSRDEPVRVAAIAALGSLGEAADTQQLVQLLSADSKAEKAAARTSLVRLPGKTISAAINTEMKRAAAPTRVTLIEILATRRALDTIPDLLSAAVDREPAVRAAAMTALGQMAGPEHLAGMVRGVLKAEKGHEREAAEKCVMLVCGRIADAEKRAEPLLAVMDKLDEADRIALLPTLGRVGGSGALKNVEAAIADSDPHRHAIGLRALCNWPEASIAPRLIDLVRTDEHADHRAMALAALIRVAPLPDKRSASERLELLQKAMTMCQRDEERNLVLKRARAIRTVESLRFVAPYLDQPPYAQQACETVVELAHHRELRDSNKFEFYQTLDKVIQTSKDATTIDRANRYKKGQTWVRPTVGEGS